ncbi:hypothetical protein HNR17_002312 [Galbitalea soli]|nr:hypothetical protein [Galbitalea soli]
MTTRGHTVHSGYPQPHDGGVVKAGLVWLSVRHSPVVG